MSLTTTSREHCFHYITALINLLCEKYARKPMDLQKLIGHNFARNWRENGLTQEQISD